MVLNAVTRNEDTPYYYDNGEDFNGEFSRNYGIANQSKEALIIIVRIQQGNLKFSVLTAERKLFYQVSYLNPVPVTLEEWIIAT